MITLKLKMKVYCHSEPLAQQTNARKGLGSHDNCAGLHVDWLSGKPVKVALRRLAPRQCATGLSWGRATIHRVTTAQPKAPPKDLASAALPRHFSGQKLRLGGDALGADPTYLLYLPFRPHGGI